MFSYFTVESELKISKEEKEGGGTPHQGLLDMSFYGQFMYCTSSLAHIQTWNSVRGL